MFEINQCFLTAILPKCR